MGAHLHHSEKVDFVFPSDVDGYQLETALENLSFTDTDKVFSILNWNIECVDEHEHQVDVDRWESCAGDDYYHATNGISEADFNSHDDAFDFVVSHIIEDNDPLVTLKYVAERSPQIALKLINNMALPEA